MADFWGNFREALGLGKANHTQHLSNISEEQRQRYADRYNNSAAKSGDAFVNNLRSASSRQGNAQSVEAPGLAWSQMGGTTTLYDGVPGDIRVIKRVRMGRNDAFADGGDTNDVTVDDVVTGMVISGMYGEGEDRKQRLYNDGFNYDRVMDRVNKAYESGKQKYYGSLPNKYGIRYRRRSGDSYAGGQQYFTPDDYIRPAR